MEEKKIFSLLRQFNEFKKNKNPGAPMLIAGRIPSFDPEESDMLFDSIETIENNFHFSKRQEYIDLGKDFLADQMTADDFSYAFMDTYGGINQEIGQMEEDESLELVNFLKLEESMVVSQAEVRELLSKTYGTCDFFRQAILDEKELKDCAQILLLKLQ